MLMFPKFLLRDYHLLSHFDEDDPRGVGTKNYLIGSMVVKDTQYERGRRIAPEKFKVCPTLNT